MNQSVKTYLFFGLSGAGKTTLTHYFAERLNTSRPIVRLDGDTFRKGVCSDLGFEMKDRKENLRRAAETAKLLNQQEFIVFASFICPLRETRDLFRNILGDSNYVGVFVDCPIDICRQRDPKGLYKKAALGAIENFTGLTSPFESPHESEKVLVLKNENLGDQEKNFLTFKKNF